MHVFCQSFSPIWIPKTPVDEKANKIYQFHERNEVYNDFYEPLLQ